VDKTQQFQKTTGLSDTIYRYRAIWGNLITFCGFGVVWLDPNANVTIPRLVAGGLIGTAGFMLRIWASGYQWHNIARPSPDARTGLITAGPYAYLRHPIYLGMLLLTVGVFLAFGSWLAAVLVLIPTFMLNLWQANYEQAFLIDKFGDEARRYCAQVPRFWPKVWAPYAIRNGTFSLTQGLKYDIGPLSAFVCFIVALSAVTLYRPPTLPVVLLVLVGSVILSFGLVWLVRRAFK